MSRLRLFFTAFISFLLLLFCSAGFAQTADFSFSPTDGCAPLVVNFTDQSTGPISSYSWNFGNSITSSLQHPSTTYTSPGVYTVTLTVTTPAGTDTKTSTLTVYDKPAVAFTATTATAGCTPHNVQFNSTVTPNSPGTVAYNWDFGDGTTGTGATAAHTYVTPGTYTVLLTATNGAGCSRTVVQNAYVTAYPVPSGGFSVNQSLFCSTPATATFINTSTGGSNPYTASWSFGDGGTGTGNTANHVYSTTGNYTVTMIVTDPHSCADTVVNAGLVTVVGTLPTFTAPTSACAEADATFTNTTNGSSSTFWTFGDGQGMSGAVATHAYSAVGTYTVTMTTIISGCTKTATQSIVVNPKPAATIVMNPAIPCPAPVTVAFIANSTLAVSYAWTWDSGGTASGQTVNKLYTANIHDKVTLITTSALGCVDTAVLDTIYIRDIWTIMDIGPGIDALAGCVPHQIGAGVHLESNLPTPKAAYPYQPNSWLWEFGDGSTDTNPAPPHTYVDTGDFFIRVIITTANGCTDSSGYAKIHVDSPEHPDFVAAPLTGCPNQWVEVLNTTIKKWPGTYYQWVFYDTSAKFQDTLIDYKQDTGKVWNRFEHAGSYTVTLSAYHRGCRSSESKFDYVVINPPDARFDDSIYCPPSTTVKFKNTSVGPTSQLWLFGDGDTSTAFSPTHTYASDGVYTVKLVVHNSVYGCTDTGSKRILVADPIIGFSGDDSAICKDEFVRFGGLFTGVGPLSYSWLTEGIRTQFDSTNLFTHQFTNRGRFDVTMYVHSGKGCLDSVTRLGYVLVSKPAVNFGAYPPIGCEPLPVLFIDSTTNTAGVNPIEYQWVFGDGDSSNNIGTSNKTYPVRGSYTVRLIVTDSLHCTDSLIRTDYVSVHKPQAVFTADKDSVCNYQEIKFTSTSTGTVPLRHDWNFGDGTTDTGYKPAMVISLPGDTRSG
jgi:PKD repeat protein